MSTITLSRASAVALVLSFLLSLAGGMAHPVVDGQAHSVAVFVQPVWPQLLIYAGALLLMLGLPGAIAHFRGRLGRLGIIGLVIYFLGNALSAQSHLVVEAFVAPTLAADPAGRAFISQEGEIFEGQAFVTLQAFGGLVLLAGLVLLGIALVVRRGLPTWAGVVLLGGVGLMFAGLPEAPVLTGLLVEVPRGVAVTALGVVMLRELRIRASAGSTAGGHVLSEAR